MRIGDLSARQTTRAFGFGSGKCRLAATAWNTDAAIRNKVMLFYCLWLWLQARCINPHSSTEWLIMEDCGWIGQQLWGIHQHYEHEAGDIHIHCLVTQHLIRKRKKVNDEQNLKSASVYVVARLLAGTISLFYNLIEFQLGGHQLSLCRVFCV